MPTYKVTIKEQTYTVDVPNPRERPVRVTVDGEPLEIWVDEATQAPAAPVMTDSAAPAVVLAPTPVAAAPAAPAGAGIITAPLPGVVTAISVTVGESIQPGQELCILEAMKMNNPIRSTLSGRVTAVHVALGQQVQHGAQLFTIGD